MSAQSSDYEKSNHLRAGADDVFGGWKVRNSRSIDYRSKRRLEHVHVDGLVDVEGELARKDEDETGVEVTDPSQHESATVFRTDAEWRNSENRFGPIEEL